MGDPHLLPEHLAADILLAALREHRAAELLDCLFNDGSATVDTNNRLVLASGDMMQQLMNQD